MQLKLFLFKKKKLIVYNIKMLKRQKELSLELQLSTDTTLYLKKMLLSAPHCLIYNRGQHSYRVVYQAFTDYNLL